jgi:hypothetical protein
MKKLFFLSFVIVILAACSPEVGSKEWCEDLKDKPNGEWTVNEAKNYTKHCLFK